MRSQWVALGFAGLMVAGCGSLPSKPQDATPTLSAGRVQVLEGPRGIAPYQIMPYITVYPPRGEQFSVDDPHYVSASFGAYPVEGRESYRWDSRPLWVQVEGVRIGWAYYRRSNQPGGPHPAGTVVARVAPDSATIWGYFADGGPGTLTVRVGPHVYTYEDTPSPLSARLRLKKGTTRGPVPLAHCYYMETEYEAYVDEGCGPSNSGGGDTQFEHVRKLRPR